MNINFNWTSKYQRRSRTTTPINRVIQPAQVQATPVQFTPVPFNVNQKKHNF